MEIKLFVYKELGLSEVKRTDVKHSKLNSTFKNSTYN
jgi:hypothetical protein